MEKVILVSPNVSSFLKKLVGILHNEEYFGFEQDAHKYVEKLREAIYNDLPNLTHHQTPPELNEVRKLLREVERQQAHHVVCVFR